jgi:hypothetical protein
MSAAATRAKTVLCADSLHHANLKILARVLVWSCFLPKICVFLDRL